MKQELGNLMAEDPQQETINLLTYRLNAVTEQRDGLRSGIDYASDQLHKVTEQRDKEREIYQKSYSAELARSNHYKQQRDRLAEALRELWKNHTLHGAAYELIEQTLQSLTTNTSTD